MSADFASGAMWTLICVLSGFIIGCVLVLLLADREDPGDPLEEPPIDPTPEELESWLERTT